MSSGKKKKKKKSMRKRLMKLKRGMGGGGSGGVKRRRSGDSKSGASGSSLSKAKRTPAGLKRGKGKHNVLGGSGDGRRARADARADRNPPSSPRVAKPPALKRAKKKIKDLFKAGKKVAKKDKKLTPKKEFATGRTLFPVDRGGGKIDYLPMASEATLREKKMGSFVTNDSVTKDPVNTLVKGGKAVTDSIKVTRVFEEGGRMDERVRTLFATTATTEDGGTKTEYLPKKSEATSAELSRGKYVPDDAVESPPKGNQVLNESPLYSFTQDRPLYATKKSDGTNEYLPKKSDANSRELKEGSYVDDGDISEKAPLGKLNSMSSEKPRYDLGKGRKVFAVKTKDGIIRLPRRSDASELERDKGLYIPDNIVDKHERKRRRTALKHDDADIALRRAQRADKLFGGVTAKNLDTAPEPVDTAKDGTEIWDGFSPPKVNDEKQRKTLKDLRPTYDLGKGRMVYPVKTALGEIQRLPLWEDASNSERIKGLYAAFVPKEPLEVFLGNAEKDNRIKRRTFETELGEVKAWSQEDINKAVDSAELVLSSAELVTEAARQNPALQQQWL